MSSIKNIDYPSYIQPVQDHPPANETSGKVKKEVDYFKKDAFKEKAPQRSYDDDHRPGQEKRVESSRKFWQKREQAAQ